MPARILFFAAAAATALGAAGLAGIVALAVGLSAGMTTSAVITWTAGSAATAFGSVIAVASLAAIVFFSDSRQTPAGSTLPERSQPSPTQSAVASGHSASHPACRQDDPKRSAARRN